MSKREVSRVVGDVLEISFAWLAAYLIYLGYQETFCVEQDGYVTVRFPSNATRDNGDGQPVTIMADAENFCAFRDPGFHRYMHTLKRVHHRIEEAKPKEKNGTRAQAS